VFFCEVFDDIHIFFVVFSQVQVQKPKSASDLSPERKKKGTHHYVAFSSFVPLTLCDALMIVGKTQWMKLTLESPLEDVKKAASKGPTNSGKSSQPTKKCRFYFVCCKYLMIGPTSLEFCTAFR
jgi:hypothetical protein